MAANDEMREWSDSLSAAWERHRDRLFENQRNVSEWLVDAVDPRPGQTVLELAAGPGETGFLAAERVGDAGKVISTDLGEGMVAAARRGAEARGLTNVEVRVMDAQANDLADGSVDAVISRYGVMLIPEPERALAGARRVLRAGGRIAYAVWGPPERNPWLTTLVAAVLQQGHAPPADPFGPGGVFSLADGDRNRALLETAGFNNVRIEEIAGVMPFADADDYWTVQSQVSGPIAIFVSSLPQDEVAGIRDALPALLEPFRAGSRYELPSLTVAATAQ